MSENEKVAFLQSQTASALIEAMGMQAENQVRASRGESPAYGEKEFASLTEKYMIGHNDVLSYLQS